MRLPLPAVVAGTLVALAGAAGLVRGAMPQAAAPTSAAPGGTGGIVITDPWVREPTPPTKSAAAYLTINNVSDRIDRLISVASGAGATATVHRDANGEMTALTAVEIPPHGSLVLAPGRGHVMIDGLFGPLKPGQTVNLELVFAVAGTIDVHAPVIARLSPAPTSGVTK